MLELAMKTCISITTRTPSKKFKALEQQASAEVNSANITAFDNCTPLDSVVEMARSVLDQGADSNGPWALQKVKNTDEKLFELPSERWRARYPMCKGDFRSRVLAEPVVTGSEHVIRLILENGVSTDVMVSVDGERATTPFGYAIAKQQANFAGCLELFLQEGCKANDVVAEASPRVTALLKVLGRLCCR